MKNAFLLALGMACLLFTGCPDRSHMRPVPDYGNISDNSLSEEEFLKQEKEKANQRK